MKIRTFQNVDGKDKYTADLVDRHTVQSTTKSDQKKSSHKVGHQAVGNKKQKRGGIFYNEEESE